MMFAGFKCYALDLFTHKHIIFPAFNVASSQQNWLDLKAIVVNERDLFVFNCSKHHSPKADHPEVFLMDLLQLNIWKKVKIRSDMRPDEFVNFGLVPIKRH